VSVPYRPSNGVEGEMFMERFCFRCAKDAAFQNGIGDSCPIAAATMIYDEDDPKYPPEWIEEDGYPRCTAFTLDASQEERERYEARRDPRQASLLP